MLSNQITTTVLLGRTGAGKSALANKLAGKQLFREGDTLNAETDKVQTAEITWPIHPYHKVTIVDSPGFGDNRPEMTNEVLLSGITQFLVSLQGGLHIALFCIPAKQRVDAHDINELDILGLLLGHELFNHLYILVTQTNILAPQEKAKIRANFENDFSRIVENHGLPPFAKDKILFADFDTLNEDFIAPLNKIIPTAKSYCPQLAEGLDPEDPESIQRLLLDDKLKPLVAKFEAMTKEATRKAEQMQKMYEEQQKRNERLIEEKRLEREQQQQIMTQIQNQLNQQQQMNQQQRADIERQRSEHSAQLSGINSQISNLQSKNNGLTKQIEMKQSSIDQLNVKSQQLENVRNNEIQKIRSLMEEQKRVHQQQMSAMQNQKKSRRRCNIF